MRRKNHKSLVFHFKVINKLINYYSAYKHIRLFYLNKLLGLLKSLLRRAVEWSANHRCLESRVLAAPLWLPYEGKFPAENLRVVETKLEFIHSKKDAIYTYHFYHLLQHAKTSLLYNWGEGVKIPEKSRFMRLEVEKAGKAYHNTQEENAVLHR
jgi:hypothetical protein